jgi:hypothetical protein
MRFLNFTTGKKIENMSRKIKEYYQIDWFRNQTASWNTNFKPIFTETLTKRGFGFSFNSLPAPKLLTREYESLQS